MKKFRIFTLLLTGLLLFNARAAEDEEMLDVSGWFECPLPWEKAPHPGSALNVGFLNHRPAGRYGFLTRVGDHFEFAGRPGEAVRFWGTNVAIHGCFPEKELAPGLAATFAAQGVNLVRMHFLANRVELLFNKEGEFNPDMLDRFEFFAAELYKQGIYLYLDLNDKLAYDSFIGQSWHWPQPPEYTAQFDPEVAEGVRNYARKLYTRVNPYTGRSIIDEPGVALYQIINERTMLMGGQIAKLPPRHKEKLEHRWQAFLKERRLPERPLPDELNADAVGRRFAFEVHRSHLADMHGFLRSLGVRVPICGSSKPFGPGDAPASAGMDFLSSHSYYDDPRGDMSAMPEKPMTWWGRPPLIEKPWAPASMMTNLGQVSLAGYPRVLGEWNYCYPNFNRCEGVPILAAMAAYQSVDALVYYCASGTGYRGSWDRFRENPGIVIHSQQTDPATWGQSQMAALIYRRGDVAPAKRQLTATLPEEALVEQGINVMNKLPFLPGLGRYSLRIGPANPLGKRALSAAAPEEHYRQLLAELGDRRSDGNRVVNDTGEIRRYVAPALFLVDTPRAQLVTGELDRLAETGDRPADLTLETPMKRGAISLVSLDGKPLRTSGRMLLTAVANAANRSIRADVGKKRLYDPGAASVVAEPFTATIGVRNEEALKVYLLHPLTGERLRELPSEPADGGRRFRITPADASIYFELAR